MKNGITKIQDYDTAEYYRNHNQGPRVIFDSPCYPKYEEGDRDPDEFDYRRLTWDPRVIQARGNSSLSKWAVFYKPDMHQVITFEDGTEKLIRTSNREADLEMLKKYIAQGYQFKSEMALAAQLLDDEDVQFEI